MTRLERALLALGLTVPCNHLVCCAACYRKCAIESGRKCPACRREVTDTITAMRP